MRVILESPFAGKTPEEAAMNEQYLNAALGHCVRQGESPYTSHALLTRPGVLDDSDPEERRMGIEAGFKWRAVAEKTVFYGDRGISRGMLLGLEHSIDHGIPVTFRSLGPKWRVDHPPEASVFDERKALEWLRLNPSIQWEGKTSSCWINHISMMFGGFPEDAARWNLRDDGTLGRYIALLKDPRLDDVRWVSRAGAGREVAPRWACTTT